MQHLSDGSLGWGPENLLPNSNSFAASGWTNQASNGGSTPVITGSFADGPDGATNAATRIQFAVNGAATDNISQVNSNVSFVGKCAVAIWLKLNTGTSQAMKLKAGLTYTDITVTNQWQKFTAIDTDPASLNPAGSGIQIGLRSSSSAATLDVLVAYAQIYRYPNASTAYVATTGTAYFGPRFDFDPLTGQPLVISLKCRQRICCCEVSHLIMHHGPKAQERLRLIKR